MCIGGVCSVRAWTLPYLLVNYLLCLLPFKILNTVNKSRELFLLFPYVGERVKDYTLIHKHTFVNDEPPYKQCSFFSISSDYYLNKSAEINSRADWVEEEHYSFYLILSKDAARFISIVNNAEKDYLDDYVQLQIERTYEGSELDKQLSNIDIEGIVSKEKASRMPKIKYMREPIIPYSTIQLL